MIIDPAAQEKDRTTAAPFQVKNTPAYSMALVISSITFLASPNTIMVLSR